MKNIKKEKNNITSFLNVELKKDLLAKFKAIAALKGITLTNFVVEIMEEEIQKVNIEFLKNK
ncbi:MAG: hypothetical protein ACP6IY_09420 [Promethearchaeia archaeon]